MKISELMHDGISIGFFGFGRSSLGVLEYLKKQYRDLKITIRSDTPPTFGIPRGARLLTGKAATRDISESVLFLSPSVRRDREDIAFAKRRGVRISSDAELFFEECRMPVIAITGSSGKSSCTALVASMLNRSGTQAIECGNFGPGLTAALGRDAVPVAELSSFQLNFFTPHTKRALITGITPNHLNWHRDFSEYAASKLRLIENSDAAAYDFDCAYTANRLSEKKLFAAVSSLLSYSELSHRCNAENYITLSGSTILRNGEKYIDISRAKRKERYHTKNFMLSSALTLDICTCLAQEEAIASFGGLAHRAELILERGGIRYINSSIDSTPERTLSTLLDMHGKNAVILCGRGKGLSYEGLVKRLSDLTAGVCLMGEITDEVLCELKRQCSSLPVLIAFDMNDALEKARTLLPCGGNIILSPSATSFDMYTSFEERGEDFRRAVKNTKVQD